MPKKYTLQIANVNASQMHKEIQANNLPLSGVGFHDGVVELSFSEDLTQQEEDKLSQYLSSYIYDPDFLQKRKEAQKQAVLQEISSIRDIRDVKQFLEKHHRIFSR